jgi:hypothetical protein
MSEDAERVSSDAGAGARADAVRQAALNAALAGALRPPATPTDLRAGVLAAIARGSTIDWQARRRDLEREHRAAIAQLNQRYLRRGRDALLVGAGVLAALGFSIKPLSLWLTPVLADAAPMVAGVMALSVGVLCGAALLRDLFKEPGSGGLRT